MTGIVFGERDAMVRTEGNKPPTAGVRRLAFLVLGAAGLLAACDIEPLSQAEPRPEVVELRLLYGADRLIEGDTTQARAIPLGADGDTLDVRVVWTSSDAAVARVDQTGEIVAIDEGRATVTARAGGLEARAPIIVLQRVASVHIVRDTVRVVVGDTVQLVAILRDADGRSALERDPVWGTADPSVASVSKRGAVRGQSPGETRVSARIDGVADTVEVSVAAGGEPPPEAPR